MISTDFSATMRLFTNGYCQPIGIKVLCNASPKGLPWFLDAGHLSFDHLCVKLIKIRYTQAGTTLSGKELEWIFCFTFGRFGCVQGERCALRSKFGPARRFESQGQPHYVSVE
jgi:hypothetical protein